MSKVVEGHELGRGRIAESGSDLLGFVLCFAAFSGVEVRGPRPRFLPLFRSAASLFLLELDFDVAARRVSERLLCVVVEVVVLQPVATGG